MHKVTGFVSFFFSLFLGSYVLTAAWRPAPIDHSGSEAATVIATVYAKNVTLGDLQESQSATLFQAENAYYQARRKALDDFINHYLLEIEAQRENVTVEELLNRHVKSAIANDPTDDALRVYYEGLDTNQPFEAIRNEILKHIRDRRIEKGRTSYLQVLRDRANVIVRLPAPRVKMDLQDSPVRGATHVGVTVVEFADYECPYCQQVDPELKRIENEYAGKVAFTFKDAPMPAHIHAHKAAEAAHCAGLQGKFWEYHDVLFANKQLDLTELKRYARQLKLDTASFDKCLDSGAQSGIVRRQIAEAQKLGLPGTPSIFVNGRLVSGAVTYEVLREVVDEELENVPGRPQFDNRGGSGYQ
jgi:protein-disulfide isomerase